jgi:hypothetical protein
VRRETDEDRAEVTRFAAQRRAGALRFAAGVEIRRAHDPRRVLRRETHEWWWYDDEQVCTLGQDWSFRSLRPH